MTKYKNILVATGGMPHGGDELVSLEAVDRVMNQWAQSGWRVVQVSTQNY